MKLKFISLIMSTYINTRGHTLSKIETVSSQNLLFQMEEVLMFCISGKEMGAPTGNWLYDSAWELTEMASMQFAVYGLINPYTYQRPKITPLPNETGLTVPGWGSGIESGSTTITVSQDRLQHSVLGEFNSNRRLINGGHGQANINYLNQNNIEYNIVKVYDNGVRVGNIPSHKNKFKRTGTGQAWFPESWTEIDIKNAGEYVANIPENVNIPDGAWIFGEYNSVRVGIIKNNGEIGTIIPDNSRQP